MLENISVIVPVYNEEKTLPEVLAEIYAVLKKDFENFEIIIVDDHSFDNSLKLAVQFASGLDHKTRVIRLEKNYGSGY
ncbi:glycosyltransferase [Candidatus Desantisbacteria bacterium]|nr:glycosyltransferase [Candidatus Desantisbacteria bacterium]